MLVAALEAKVPKIEVVPERLLQEERGLKGRASVAANSERAMTGKRRPKATSLESSVISGGATMNG